MPSWFTPVYATTRHRPVLHREAQRRLHISGEELVRLYRAGLLKDCGKVADLLALTSLLAEDDPLFAAA